MVMDRGRSLDYTLAESACDIVDDIILVRSEKQHTCLPWKVYFCTFRAKTSLMHLKYAFRFSDKTSVHIAFWIGQYADLPTGQHICMVNQSSYLTSLK